MHIAKSGKVSAGETTNEKVKVKGISSNLTAHLGAQSLQITQLYREVNASEPTSE